MPLLFFFNSSSCFKDDIHKFPEVYFDDWMVYGMVKNLIETLRMMLGRWRQFHIYLNVKKCIFCPPFGVLLSHVICQEGILMDPTKIAIIVNLPPPFLVKQLRTTLGHIGYYRKFIR